MNITKRILDQKNFGGYYGGDETISFNDDDDMIDRVLIPGLLAVQGLLLIG